MGSLNSSNISRHEEHSDDTDAQMIIFDDIIPTGVGAWSNILVYTSRSNNEIKVNNDDINRFVRSKQETDAIEEIIDLFPSWINLIRQELSMCRDDKSLRLLARQEFIGINLYNTNTMDYINHTFSHTLQWNGIQCNRIVLRFDALRDLIGGSSIRLIILPRDECIVCRKNCRHNFI